jgi:hypothetical protein
MTAGDMSAVYIRGARTKFIYIFIDMRLNYAPLYQSLQTDKSICLREG